VGVGSGVVGVVVGGVSRSGSGIDGCVGVPGVVGVVSGVEGVGGGVVLETGGGVALPVEALPLPPPPPQAARSAATASPMSEFLFTLIFLFDRLCRNDCVASYEQKEPASCVGTRRRY
jgi:hypothetical protein